MTYPMASGHIDAGLISKVQVSAPQPEVVAAEHELAEAMHTLAVMTEHYMDARTAHAEARERAGMLTDRVLALRKEHDV